MYIVKGKNLGRKLVTSSNKKKGCILELTGIFLERIPWENPVNREGERISLNFGETVKEDLES